MNTDMIDLKELGSALKRRLPVILIAALICGILFNIYGVRKANTNESAAEQQHEAYEKAAEELPGYYTERLYNLRSRLSDHAAEFVEAYANIYKSFLEEYKTENEDINTENLEAYMMFLDSYKDVLSVMSGAQREYYELLLATDTKNADGHPLVSDYENATVSYVQPVWFISGILFGAVVISALIVIIFTISGYEGNKKK